MDIKNQTAGGLLFALLLLLFVFWIAYLRNFFTLPQQQKAPPITLKQTAGAFFSYFLFAYFLLPVAQIFIGFLITGELTGYQSISKIGMSWMQWLALVFLFLVLLSYIFLIDASARRFIFWGEGKGSLRRLGRGFGMGILGWMISYPSVLFVSILTHFIALWIWGETQVEQVAVQHLKMTRDSPLLYGCMVFAIVFLVPFMEELLFRGFLQNYLKRHLSRVWAMSITALFFALVHFAPSQAQGNFQLILSLFTLALFLSFIYEREQTLWAPIALHMTFNGISVVAITLNVPNL